MDLRIRQYLSKAQKRKDLVSLKKAYELIRSDCGSVHYEFCVLCAELSLQLGCRGITQDCVRMLLNWKPPANQFLCRVYLCQGQLTPPHNITTEEDLDKAVMCYLKAIEIAKDNPRYHFLVFNASLLYFRSVRMFLRPGRRQHLVSSLAQVLKALEEIQDSDHAWRAELMLHQVECLFDAGKELEAAGLLKVTSGFIESHKAEVYPRLFSIQVRHNLIDESDMMNNKNPKLLVIYKIQKLKHMIEVHELKDDCATLKETFLLLTSHAQSSSPPPDAQCSSPPPDAQCSSPPPDAQSSSPPPDAQSSSPPPDASTRPPPDAQSSSPPPDAQCSSPPPDASTRPPPDAQSSSPPPDAQSSSPPPDASTRPPPDAQSSSPPPDAQCSSSPPDASTRPPPDAQSSSFPPDAQCSSPPPDASTRPPPDAQSSSPPPDAQCSSPPADAQSSSPPPDAQCSSPPPDASTRPPPDAQSSSPPPDAQCSSPPPDAQRSSPPPDAQCSSPPPDAQCSSPPPDAQSSSPPADAQSSSPPPDAQCSSPPPDASTRPPPDAQSSSPPPDAQRSSPPADAQSSSPPPDAQCSSPPPDASTRPPPDAQSSSPPPDAQSSSPPPDAQSSSPPADAQSSSPPPDAQSSSPPPDAQSSSPPPDASTCPPPDTDHSSLISLADRIEFLLELAFLALRLDQHQVASNCLKQLRNTDVTVSQRIMMECVQCEIDLIKPKDRIESYSRSSVELQLSVVGRLDALLQAAVRERDARLIQAVCVAQWNTCLPLLQPHLRKKIKKPLLTLTRALETTDSVLLDVLCEVHAELAGIEEDDDRLEAAMKHLKKALQLDHRGLLSQHLSFSLHFLQLRSSLHSSSKRPEDQAARLIQQAKGVRGRGTDRRPMLITAGITLAPDEFSTVMNADSTMKDAEAQDHLTQLADKAQHHTTCVQKVKGHLTGLDKNLDDRERVKLWALLAKTAWTYEVYDVCRAACRFCLLYDDGRWKNSIDDLRGEEKNHTHQKTQTELLRLLAEVHFINAQVTVLKLRSEAVELNASAAPPEKKLKNSREDDPRWTLYSDWIKDLSSYATANFLRGAEHGAELSEDWLVVNGAVHLWNYNRWLLISGGHQFLLPTYSRLLELLRQTGHAGEVDLLVLLCDAVAQGLITSAQAETRESERRVTQLPDEKPKKGRGKAAEKSSGLQFDTAVMQDVKKALEVCDYALRLSNGNAEPVCMQVRKQIISTWVTVKQLLHQQIGQKLDIRDQSQNEAVTAMSRVLVGVEMLQCNRNRMMEFTVPSLSVLVQMTQASPWSDSVVELYVWTRLALFAHQTRDRDLVMTCTHNALQLEQSALNRLKTGTNTLLEVCSVQEMLCSAACVRGQSLIHEVSVHSSRYMEALQMLESSVRYGEQAGSWCLCMTAAGHYWNTCLPLLNMRQDRSQLRKPLELILQAINNTYNKHTTKSRRSSEVKSTEAVMNTSDYTNAGGPDDDDDVKVWVCMYSALLYVYADSGDWTRGLQVLDEAVRVIPPSTHRLIVYKQRALVNARLGHSVVLDMQQVCDEGEIICSHMWQRVALCAKDKHQRLTSYQNAITTLKAVSCQGQKVEFLLEFGEWLYFTQFPVTDARLQMEWAVDLLMFTYTHSQHTDDAVDAGGVIPETLQLGLGVNAAESAVCLSDVREIRRLEGLIRAHTLLALMEDRSSPKHQQHLLMAYGFTLHIWKVSVATAQEVMKDMLRNRSAVGRKERPDEKQLKQSSVIMEKSRGKAPDISLPISPEQWAQFECPEVIRQAFCYDTGPYSINTTSICVQKRTLFYLDVLVRELESIGLTPLTFAPLHLAEVIAHDLTQSRSLSDLYRLRIIRNCQELDFQSPYCEERQSFTHVPEEEQMQCCKSIVTQRSRSQLPSDSIRDETSADEGDVFRSRLSVCELCLEKADVCLMMNLHESVKPLLTRAHIIAEELGEQMLFAKSLHLLAVVANEKQRFSEAVDLLQQAQEFSGDENFWYLLVQTLMTAVAGRGGQDAYQQVCEITDQACRTFRSVLEQRQNLAGDLRFFIASLEIRGSVVRRQLLCADGLSSSLTDSSLEILTSVCDTLKRAASELLQLGYRTHAADAMLEHANTLRFLAVHTVSEEEKQRHLLDSFDLTQTAVSLQEDVITGVLNLLPPHQSGWCNLPALRVCVRMRLALADLGLMMLEIQCADEKRRAIARDMMSSEERAVEEFMRSSSDLTDLQKEWCRVGQCLGQVILTHLTAVNSLSLDCTETRARSLGMMGRCLKILAQQRDPLYPSALWEEPIMNHHRPEEKKETEEHTTHLKMRDAECKYSTELQMNRRCAQHLMCQASETLLQSVSLSLHYDLPHIIPDVCTDLLECHGQFDPSASGQYLALLQSSVCCAEMSFVLHSVCSGVSESDLRRNLTSHVHRSRSVLTSVRREHAGLNQVCSHLSINPKHTRILGEMPANLKILLLQHSQDGCVLYGGLYEKVNSTETQKGRSVIISTGGVSCCKVVKVSVQHSDLLQLHKHLQDFKHEQTDVDVDVVFRSLVQEMENYLHPLLSQFDFSCLSMCSSSVSARGSAPDKPQPEAGVCVVILADRMLLDLPLEALAVLQVDGIGSVSRDFSLQVLHARLQTDDAVATDNKKEVKGVRGVKGRDESKDIKAVPVSRVLPPHTFPVDTHKFRYLVTAQQKDDGPQAELMSPAENMRLILDSYTPQFTSLWDGFICDHTPSFSDVEKLLSFCSAFIYCGMKNLLSCVPADRLININMSGCQMVLLFDCEQSRAARLHQSTHDNIDSVMSARLFTLIGCRSVLLNQWSCSAAVNMQNMRLFMDNLLRRGLTSAEAVHVLRTCETQNADVSGKPSGPTGDITAAASPEDFTQKHKAVSASNSNFIIYGLPNLMVT